MALWRVLARVFSNFKGDRWLWGQNSVLRDSASYSSRLPDLPMSSCQLHVLLSQVPPDPPKPPEPPDPPDLPPPLRQNPDSHLTSVHIAGCCSKDSLHWRAYFGVAPSSLSLGPVSPVRNMSPVSLKSRPLPFTTVPVSSPLRMFPQVCSTPPSDSPSLNWYRFKVKYVALVWWNSYLYSLIMRFSSDCGSSCGSLIVLVRFITVVCRLCINFIVIVVTFEGSASIRGFYALVSATTVWKLPSFRCPLPQYEDLCSSTLYVAVVWELRRSSFQGFDILLEWSTIIIFGSAQVHSLKVAKLLFLQPHLSLPSYASNGFMVAVRTDPSKLHGTKGCGDLVVGVFLFVGSSRRCFVAIALIADSLVVKAAPAGASFMDFRSPSVISDSEGVLSVFYSKDVSITGLFGVMYASIGFLYASRLAIVAAVIWTMLALLSFMLSFLLNISSTLEFELSMK